MQESNRVILHEASQYLLKAIRQQTSLIIEVFSKAQNERYQRVIHQNNIPIDILSNLKNIQIIWECLKEEESVSVDLSLKVIRLNSYFGARSKMEKIQTEVQLYDKNPLNDEQLRRQFHLLQNKVLLMEKETKYSNIQKLVSKELSVALKKFTHQIKEELEQNIKQMFNRQKAQIFYEIVQKTDEQITEAQNMKKQIKQRKKQIDYYNLNMEGFQDDLRNLEENHIFFQQKIHRIEQKIFEYGNEKKNKTYSPKLQKEQTHNSFEKKMKQNFIFFQIKEGIIRYLGEDKQWTFIDGNNVIKKNCISEHKFRISKTKFKNISIGVLDRLQARGQRRALGMKYSISYLSDQGVLYDRGSRIHKGIVFNEKDQVKLRIDTSKGELEFNIEGRKFVHKCKEWLLDPKKQIVPFIELYRTGDEVQWLY